MLDFHSGSIMRKHARTLLTVALAVAGIGVASAQDIQLMNGETAPASQSEHQGMGNSMQGMDHSAMQGMDHGSMQGMDHGSMQGMDHGSMNMQGGSAPPDARDPDAYSGGYQLGTGKYALGDPRHMMMMADEHNFGSVLVDRLEWVHGSDANATAYELQARFGSVYNKAVLKAEGDVSKGRFEEARTELLWSHAVSTFWDTQLGIRNDTGFGRPARNWVAFGVQGLAPYWFDLEATAYVGNSGRTALRLSSEYELLLTQRLILQPRVEANFYGKRDPDLAIGSGLSNATAGLRLRYEFSRQFAPYIGVERSQSFGGTANMIEAAGGRRGETRFVAGVRLWF
ncbi:MULTISPECIES: copper resistance protein B [Ralstonia]|jgi:copper resistance protein B|uniref:Copper resistance protein B n=1 Tax=Ralstonia pickettii TaxID=329 RepID=A0A7X2HK58_RALPI|nr:MULTISPECIES: copper resistance protein B [Ralstonia]AJW43453.1 copper resistance protein CopB [Ralstonia mannitolilytica]AJW47377.1 copper resistance protein CopB [Ralstonia mannitolilytica]MRS98007.1 copper resistance protein B [Ralstonia pickettii]QIF09732.1 copper resistance protein B [Ralstonia mannitolilytica]CAJ0729555.1 Copper resistance protein B [Ralstonia mannitolilytica]